MPLKVSDGMGAWIKDFKKSDAPQFKGKSEKERREMAMAAYLSAKRGDKKESVEENVGAPRTAAHRRAQMGIRHSDLQKKPPFDPDPPSKNKPRTNSDGSKTSPMSRARQLAKMARDRNMKKESVELDEKYSWNDVNKALTKANYMRGNPAHINKVASKFDYKSGNDKKFTLADVKKNLSAAGIDASRQHNVMKHMKESVELEEKFNWKVSHAGKDVHVKAPHAGAAVKKAQSAFGNKDLTKAKITNLGKVGTPTKEDTQLDEMKANAAYTKAAKDIKAYAAKDGGIDKKDMMNFAADLELMGKAPNILQAGQILDRINKRFKGYDTDVRDRLSMYLKKNGLMESVEIDEAMTSAIMIDDFFSMNPGQREKLVKLTKKYNLQTPIEKRGRRNVAVVDGDKKAMQKFEKELKGMGVKFTATESVEEAKSFDQKFKDHLKFATSNSPAVQAYMKKKASQRRADAAKQDPGATKKSLGPAVVDRQKAYQKARKKGLPPGQRVTYSGGLKRKLPEETDLSEEMMFKVSIEGLPDMIMLGNSPSNIKAVLRKIVKQPSMIGDIDRMTKGEVKKRYRDMAQDRVDEATSPNPEDNEPASPDEMSMAVKQAEFIQYVGKEIVEHLVKNKEFPEWMQNKLSALHQKAKDMHSTLGAHGDMDEATQVDEISADLAKRYHKKATAPGAYKPASDAGHTKDSMRKAHNRVVGSNRAMDRMFRRDKTYKK